MDWSRLLILVSIGLLVLAILLILVSLYCISPTAQAIFEPYPPFDKLNASLQEHKYVIPDDVVDHWNELIQNGDEWVSPSQWGSPTQDGYSKMLPFQCYWYGGRFCCRV